MKRREGRARELQQGSDMNQQRQTPQAVSVDTYARLHLGFLDMSGTLGRRFGSLGISIEAFHTRLSIRRGKELTAKGPSAARAVAFAKRVLEFIDAEPNADILIEKEIPGHLGLGSGTQMALAVGRALTALYGKQVSTREIARLLNRGARSGIGVGAFDRGGFLVDSGVDDEGHVPPVIARFPFPEDWRILLVIDVRGKGLHGHLERAAFRDLSLFPAEQAARLCHLTLMQILPAVQERMFQPVAEGIAELQRTVGDHFARAQGGRYTSPAVAMALEWASSQGFRGVGQSSWGPTGFILAPNSTAAEELQKGLSARFGGLSPLRFHITAACNQGSIVQMERQVDALREVR